MSTEKYSEKNDGIAESEEVDEEGTTTRIPGRLSDNLLAGWLMLAGWLLLPVPPPHGTETRFDHVDSFETSSGGGV